MYGVHKKIDVLIEEIFNDGLADSESDVKKEV